jgi:hypothetical protein
MKLPNYTENDIIERRDEYKRALRFETQASRTVRHHWALLVKMLDDLLEYGRAKPPMSLAPEKKPCATVPSVGK